MAHEINLKTVDEAGEFAEEVAIRPEEVYYAFEFVHADNDNLVTALWLPPNEETECHVGHSLDDVAERFGSAHFIVSEKDNLEDETGRVLVHQDSIVSYLPTKEAVMVHFQKSDGQSESEYAVISLDSLPALRANVPERERSGPAPSAPSLG